MKRKNFLITSYQGHRVIKHTWNAANRHVVDIVREIARSKGVLYELKHRTAEKVGFDHVYGTQIWECRENSITFTVAQVKDSE